MTREEVTDWEMAGNGTEDDPYRPDVFDKENEDVQYHFEPETKTLYRIIE